MRQAWTATLLATCILFFAGSAAWADERMFASVVKGLKDPGFFKATVAHCVRGVRKEAGAIEFNVRLTGLPASRAPEVSCERLMTAYRDGRYTYEHQKAVSAGTYPPEVVRIIQGK